jgi:hypothetical protein
VTGDRRARAAWLAEFIRQNKCLAWKDVWVFDEVDKAVREALKRQNCAPKSLSAPAVLAGPSKLTLTILRKTEERYS